MKSECSQIGDDALTHMSFLVQSPDRVVALRLALSRVVGPSSRVLDAGCGALGLLGIMAAKLGAARVVAVDRGDLSLAKTLAAENGVADRMDWVEGDLRTLDLQSQRFDVIVGMIYYNHVTRDCAQQQLMARLLERHGHARTVCIPNKVRYLLSGYDWPALDASNKRALWRTQWERDIEDAERHAGVRFGAIRAMLREERTAAKHLDRRSLPKCDHRGAFDKSAARQIAPPALFAEIDYSDRTAPKVYPERVTVNATGSGQLTAVVWQQDLLFDDILVRSTESLSLVVHPPHLAQGSRAVISTGDRWIETNLLSLAGDGEPEV